LKRCSFPGPAISNGASFAAAPRRHIRRRLGSTSSAVRGLEQARRKSLTHGFSIVLEAAIRRRNFQELGSKRRMCRGGPEVFDQLFSCRDLGAGKIAICSASGRFHTKWIAEHGARTPAPRPPPREGCGRAVKNRRTPAAALCLQMRAELGESITTPGRARTNVPP